MKGPNFCMSKKWKMFQMYGKLYLQRFLTVFFRRVFGPARCYLNWFVLQMCAIFISCIVVLRLVLLCCVVLCCVALWSTVLCCVALLCVVIHSLTGRQSLHQRTRQTQPPLANLMNSSIFTYFKTVWIPQRNQLDKLNKPHSVTDKISTTRQTHVTTLTKQTNLTILTYFKTVI